LLFRVVRDHGIDQAGEGGATEGIMPKSNTPKLNDTQLVILSRFMAAPAATTATPPFASRQRG